ncbi:MAG TPA: hypothetical protein VK436_06285 [Methanocella sp.]|nr:hypothetical protein [Methanocella sp.]
MNNIWKNGITSGALGCAVTLLNFIVAGVFFGNFTASFTVFMLCLLAANTLAFIVAGLHAGLLASRHTIRAIDSLKVGLIAGSIVGYLPLFLLLLFAARELYTFPTQATIPMPPIASGLILLLILLIQIAMTGLISFIYASYLSNRKQPSTVMLADRDEDELIELKATYDDLWKDARVLATDLDNSILLYLIVGLFAVIGGFIIATYALASWLHISDGSADLTNSAAAIGETIGSVVLLIAGPLLIKWYFRLKSRYSSLARFERDPEE